MLLLFGAKGTANQTSRRCRRAVALALVAPLLTMMPATVAAARSKSKKPPTTTTVPSHETVNIWFSALGDFTSDARANDGGCQLHDKEQDHLDWDTQYSDIEVNLNGDSELATASADLAVSSSTWKTVNSNQGEEACSNLTPGPVTVTCTSDHVDSGGPDDPKPGVWWVNTRGVLSLRVQAIGADFIANDTQGNNACPTQVTGSGQLLFAVFLNAGLASNIPGYFTAHLQIPDSKLAVLAVGKNAKDYSEHVTMVAPPNIDAPKTSCVHGIWTACTDSLNWQGNVLIHRVG
jgi:hypothetical protein